MARIRTIKPELPQSLYLIEAIGVPVTKVGISANPKSRLMELQVGNHLKLRIHTVWTPEDIGDWDAKYLEYGVLGMLGRFAANGEWLNLPADQLSQCVNDLLRNKKFSWRRWLAEFSGMPETEWREPEAFIAFKQIKSWVVA